jgi:hypothetical protein
MTKSAGVEYAPHGIRINRRVNLVEVARKTRQPLIRQRSDRPQRMVRWNAPLQRHVAEETFRALIFPAHRLPSPKKESSNMHGITLPPPHKQTFSATC